ncbi:Uncharacterised protein [Legionella lansingensis]|uniref:Tetratricopeptide repeat protein n=1 Tax=Legionella lansingensis TaxID=45067 RepID=A0A0W0VGA7_9GAMM|nr:hypothetical protein [Legionella lansingensis]KTD19119.1 hypothetical protein Llan_2190 [Legionella lansingensis]SNV45655.1 Uncharacterised protein [Legionella lansingensis]
MRLPHILLVFLAVGLSACEKMALLFTPAKKPILSTSELAKKAENYFWDTLHQGRYYDIPKADYLLMAAYLANPNDPKLAARLGFIHIWKITERKREAQQSPKITNEIVLAKKYFGDAVQLAPENPIYQGFFGDSQLIEGKIFNDKREEVRGYYTLKRAIKRWPEFNYFTAGYPMSDLPANSEHFQEALEWQWKVLDLCAGEKVSRDAPSFSKYMGHQTKLNRACQDSWIAPHNFEGFFMNMGDMLVKAGDWQTGIKIYQNAKLAKNYSSWPYRQLLEAKIKNAKENVGNFQKDLPNPDKTIMFNSGYGCVICHQR